MSQGERFFTSEGVTVPALSFLCCSLLWLFLVEEADGVTHVKGARLSLARLAVVLGLVKGLHLLVLHRPVQVSVRTKLYLWVWCSGAIGQLNCDSRLAVRNSSVKV